NYCTVSLVFDNSDRKLPIDADTVTLTRTIRRAPLKDNPDNYYSYFYINGKAASLSDFTNLLTHARISGDGYNLVKQGDVTSLVETGPVERRKVIDEIAGISVFDSDIEKAEKEKKEAEENIQRISIVLDEINRQLTQLKKERDEALRYKELQDKLYETKARIAYKKKVDIEEQLAELQRQVESYEKEKQKLEEQKKEKLRCYNEAQKKLEEIEQKIASSGGEEAREVKEKIDSFRTELAKIEERITHTKNSLKEIERERLNLLSSLQELEKEIEEHNAKIQEIEGEIVEKEQEVAEAEKELSELREALSQSDGTSVEITRELAKLREEYEETTTRLHQLQLERERVVEKIDSLSTQIAELEETKGTYEFELKDVEWQISEASKEKKTVLSKKTRIEKEIFDKRREEAELTEQLKDVEQALRVLQKEYSQLKAEYEASESIRKGYTTAVLKILEARDAGVLKGVHGTVAELARVDPKYEVAMQVAGGQRLQAIIVDNDSVAAEAIEFLRKNNLGRATFLPLNKMIIGKPRAKAHLVVQDKKSHGFALDLISFKKEYESAFWYVFGDTVVVEDLDAARQLMGGVRLVTLDGDVVEASGAMKGGSVKEHVMFSQVDRSKLDEAERKLREATETHDVLVEKINGLRDELDKLHQDLQEINLSLPAATDNLEVQRKEFSAKITVITEELEGKIKEKKEKEEEISVIDQKIEELQGRLEELEKLKEEKGKLLLKGKGKDLTQRVRELEEKLFTLRDSLVRLKGEYDSLKKQLEFLESRKKEYEDKLRDIDEEVSTKKEMIEELQQTKSKHREELEALISVESKMTGRIKGLSEEKDRVFRETVSLETEIDKITTRIESYVDLISRATYRIPTLEDALQDLEEEISRYDVSIDVSDLPSVESLLESAKLIEENMRELEPVNMRALEEYEHQAKRKEKLEEDVQRLREQKRNLNRVVKEIVKKKKDRFYEVFNEINDNFKQVYSRLSEGGEASLELENPEDPFDGGLNIKVRPRGKKVLNLNALSGGEKSMASLALIFAIQNYDPSPFYVLDEVDMYLDSINAEAVSRMIKENASHTQFIMVSLRKVAIKEADHIYGVTMREDGITEMIGTVDLSSIGPKGEILTSKGGVGG
ncbi:MAG: chromosome segregation protein SMC, partial [Candidatus Asgardarchaeia archaeon]